MFRVANKTRFANKLVHANGYRFSIATRLHPATAEFIDRIREGAGPKAGIVNSYAGIHEIDQFVREVHNSLDWSQFICWPMRERHNAGTGTTLYSLGGLGTFDGTLINGPTWGEDGITIPPTARISLPYNKPFSKWYSAVISEKVPNNQRLGVAPLTYPSAFDPSRAAGVGFRLWTRDAYGNVPAGTWNPQVNIGDGWVSVRSFFLQYPGLIEFRINSGTATMANPTELSFSGVSQFRVGANFVYRQSLSDDKAAWFRALVNQTIQKLSYP